MSNPPITEIQERSELWQVQAETPMQRHYATDTQVLLERIEHLERENERLKSYERSWIADHYGEEAADSSHVD